MTSFIVHSNNYYWVDLVVSNANALVTFESELPSVLPNPQFIARAGATNRVVLLLGKPYEVKCAQPIVCVETSHSDVEVMERYEGCLEICRPVVCEFVSLPRLMAAPQGHGLLGLGGGGMTISLSPEPEGYAVSLGACCCMMQSGSGLPYFYCMGYCGCGGCSSGDISVAYDGTALAFPGYSCPCSHEPQPGPDTPQDDSSGPNVSASFSKQAIIFEDAYENEPGVTIPRRSTDVEVEFCVYGGTNGGTYAFSIVGSNKLARVNGDALREGTVAVGQVITVKARYEGRAASGSEGDIIAKAEFTENGSGQHLSDEHSQLTAVKVELIPERTVKDCLHRHRWGVCERIICDVRPNMDSVSVAAANGTDLETAITGQSSPTLVCPDFASEQLVAVTANGIDFAPSTTVEAPMALSFSNVRQLPSDLSPGVPGGAGMSIEVYVLPDSVSFMELRFREIPSNASDVYGYFANTAFSEAWYHSRKRGAGVWHLIGLENYFFTDNASMLDALLTPYSDGHILWTIPIGWKRNSGPNGLERQLGTFQQNFEMNSVGTLKVSKFGFWVERAIDGSMNRSSGVLP